MHLWRVLPQCLQRIEDRRQRFVVDLDLFDGGLGNLLGECRHRRDAVARVKHALIGQHWLVLQRRTEGIYRDLAARQHGQHTRHGLGLARIDTSDACGRDTAR